MALVYADCRQCKKFKECYPKGHDKDSLVIMSKREVEAMQQRDLCSYNDKDLYEQKD